MQDEPKLIFQTYADPFAESPQFNNSFPFGFRDRGCGGAQQERRSKLDTFEPVIKNSLRQRFDVNGDVRKFRHSEMSAKPDDVTASGCEIVPLTMRLNEFNRALDNLARPFIVVFEIKAVMAGGMISEIEGHVTR